MHNRKDFTIVEALTHGSGSIRTVCEVSKTAVTPALDHVGDAQRGIAVQIAGIVIGDDINAFIEVQGLKIPLIPARNRQAIITGGFRARLDERIEIFDGSGNGDAVLIGQALVIINNLCRMQERQ